MAEGVGPCPFVVCKREAPAKGGAGTRNIWLGGSLVAVVSDGQTWCLMADALGSVVAVTNPAGQAIKRNYYKPFGEARTEGAQIPSAGTAVFVGGWASRATPQRASTTCGIGITRRRRGGSFPSIRLPGCRQRAEWSPPTCIAAIMLSYSSIPPG